MRILGMIQNEDEGGYELIAVVVKLRGYRDGAVRSRQNVLQSRR